MYRLDRDIPRAKIARRNKAQQELEQLAQERRELQAALAANRIKMHQALAKAYKAHNPLGFGVTDLARFTGMTRRAIYNVLETSGPEVDESHPGARTAQRRQPNEQPKGP